MFLALMLKEIDVFCYKLYSAISGLCAKRGKASHRKSINARRVIKAVREIALLSNSITLRRPSRI